LKRIAIIGAGGAGKTRLVCALGQALDLPAVVDLDAYYYGPGLATAPTGPVGGPLLRAWQVLRRWALGHLGPSPGIPPGLRPELDR
jgi:hypothetical protein